MLSLYLMFLKKLFIFISLQEKILFIFISLQENLKITNHAICGYDDPMRRWTKPSSQIPMFTM